MGWVSITMLSLFLPFLLEIPAAWTIDIILVFPFLSLRSQAFCNQGMLLTVGVYCMGILSITTCEHSHFSVVHCRDGTSWLVFTISVMSGGKGVMTFLEVLRAEEEGARSPTDAGCT